MPTGHFLSGPSSDPSARHLLVRPRECTGWRKINRIIYFCCPSSAFLQQNPHTCSQSGAQCVLHRLQTCNDERQSFAKLPYSAIDNVLTSLLPAGLQDFFQVLNVSNATTMVNRLLECSPDRIVYWVLSLGYSSD